MSRPRHPRERICSAKGCPRILAPGSSRCHEHKPNPSGTNTLVKAERFGPPPTYDREAMLREADAGASTTELMVKYGVARPTINRAIKAHREQVAA